MSAGMFRGVSATDPSVMASASASEAKTTSMVGHGTESVTTRLAQTMSAKNPL